MKIRAWVHDDKTDGVAPVEAELTVSGMFVHLRTANGLHLAIEDEDVLRVLEDDTMEHMRDDGK